MKKLIKKIVPDFIFYWYHWKLAFLGALIYGFPSRKIFVLGVTGTKGKTTVLEIVNAILEEAGYKTALFSTLRFKIGSDSRRNELKMTMPGRFSLQGLLRKAVNQGCRYALIEMTSQGVLQSRHKFIDPDAMIFTNLAPEHIEAHGSFEKYREAKMKLFEALQKSPKPKKVNIVNIDDKNAEYFLNFKAGEERTYGLKDVSDYKISENGIDFSIGAGRFHSPLLGKFNLYNILAAVSFAKLQNISGDIIRNALEKFPGVPGRLEFINEGQNFKVVVDYAHTPDSLEQVYKLFSGARKICVLGSAGGGRDKWKRKEMGKIAATYCDEIILTNEDPYDEKPEAIIEDIALGFLQIPSSLYKIIDRREAIRKALGLAKQGNVVIITGKGAEPWIVGPGGIKIKWDDREAVREELKKLN